VATIKCLLHVHATASTCLFGAWPWHAWQQQQSCLGQHYEDNTTTHMISDGKEKSCYHGHARRPPRRHDLIVLMSWPHTCTRWNSDPNQTDFGYITYIYIYIYISLSKMSFDHFPHSLQQKSQIRTWSHYRSKGKEIVATDRRPKS
jgi:hypothetical protein